MRRSVLALALPLVLSACASEPKVFGQGAPGPDFVIEKVFVGRGTGEGTFVNALSGAKRPFKVTFNGVRTKGGLNLAENISYADGQKERHLWRFTRTGPNAYEGRREDLVGVARGTTSGNTLRLSYDVKLNTGGSTAQVHFEDALVLHAPGVVLNNAQVSKLGVKVGTVDLAITMGGRRR